MENEEFKYQNYEEKRKAEEENIKNVEEDTRVWLETDEAVRAYFDGFSKYWADGFVKGYPALKACFMRYGNKLGDQPEQREIAYINAAGDRLMDIQLKKLFDVMCQWDANLLRLDDIACSWDFFPWQHDIGNCPFITPITDEEVRLYLRFLESDDFDELQEIEISDYHLYRDKEEDEVIPGWFSFENVYSGNGKYLLLPMLRTDKEEFYRDLCRAEYNAGLEKKYESGELQRYIPDNRPEISISKYADIERFIIAYESKEILIAFRKYYNYFTDQLIRDDPADREDGWLTEQVKDILHYLTGVKEKIPIEAALDWRQGLIDAYAKYGKRKLIEAIPYAFDDYKMMRELNINKPGNKRHIVSYSGFASDVRNQILRGRELNGEPGDFDF